MDCNIQVHTVAWHQSGSFEAVVPGVAALCGTPIETLRVSTGVFRNSERGWSFYSAAVWQPIKLGSVKAGVAAGVVTGYRKHNVLPLGGLALSIEQSTIEHHILVVPRAKGVAPLTVQYSVSWRF